MLGYGYIAAVLLFMPDCLALDVVYKPVSPSLNVIFIHGLGGDPVETWSHKGGCDDGYYWPLWLKEKIPEAAVYTLRYPSKICETKEGWPLEISANSVLDYLTSDFDHINNPDHEIPLIFICHSLGGLVVKKVIVEAFLRSGASPRTKKLLERIVGVSFLATPHRGSILATIAKEFHWFVTPVVGDLAKGDEALNNLRGAYRDCIHDIWPGISHSVYYETGKWGLAVVTEESSNPDLPHVKLIRTSYGHREIVKPSSRSDPVYRGVVCFLQDRPKSKAEVRQACYALVDDGGLYARAAEHGIEKRKVQEIVDRFLEERLDPDCIVVSLNDCWIENVARLLEQGTNEDEAFEAARQEALRRFRKGDPDASDALLEELVREERKEASDQEEHRRRKLRLLEEAVSCDVLSFNLDKAVEGLRRIGILERGEEHLGLYLFERAGLSFDEGEQKGDNVALLLAIGLYREALKERTQERVPLDWATTQNNLGNALARLGGRESGIQRLEEAVRAYRAALEERTRERVPLDWAATQNNLGNILVMLGEREGGTGRLEEAVVAYRAALEERTRERVPLAWAMTQNNLGTALARLGERESGTERLEEAVKAYRAALEERTRERVPLSWATTQNNLGNVLLKLGERENETARLKEAVVAYRAALEEWPRERVPLDWAMTQNNLGNALARLGERESGTGRLEEAVEAYRAALEERTRERVPLAWATTQNNLGNALGMLGERDAGTEYLEDAVGAFLAALEERTRERVPLDWATTQNNLGNALGMLGERENSSGLLEDAVGAFLAALEERTRERVPLDWAATQNSLGNALAWLGEREGDVERLVEAEEAFRAALEEWTVECTPHWNNIARQNLARCLALLAKRGK